MFEYLRHILGKYLDVHTSKKMKDNGAVSCYSATPFYYNQLFTKKLLFSKFQPHVKIYEEFDIHSHGISSFNLSLKTLRVTIMEGKVLVKIPKSIEYSRGR